MCLACRNLQKAESARESLLASCPGSKVDILQVDVSSITSVREAAAELQRRCGHIGICGNLLPHVHALHAAEADIFNAIHFQHSTRIRTIFVTFTTFNIQLESELFC